MLPPIKTLLEDLKGELATGIREHFDCLEDLCALLKSSINDDPPISVRDGNIIKPDTMRKWTGCGTHQRMERNGWQT